MHNSTPSEAKLLDTLFGLYSTDQDLRRAVLEYYSELVGADPTALGSDEERRRWLVEALKSALNGMPPDGQSAADREKYFRYAEVTRGIEIARAVDTERQEFGLWDLESGVREHGIYETTSWVGKLAQMQNRVCVIEYRDGNRTEVGTGFLIADNLILTSYHAVSSFVEDATADFKSIRCVFDRGTMPGVETVHELHSDEPVLDYAPGPKNELQPSARSPLPYELDFALLRLAKPAGRDLVSDSVRGTMTINAAPVLEEISEPLIVLQHPGGGSSHIALGVLKQPVYNKNRTRFLYKVVTDGGSSGAPCISFNLDVIGIHQARTVEENVSITDRHVKNAVIKQGIPMTAILDRLRFSGAWKAGRYGLSTPRSRGAESATAADAPIVPALVEGLPAQIGKNDRKTVHDDAITKFCLELAEKVGSQLPIHPKYAKLDIDLGGRIFWMSDSASDLNENSASNSPVLYYEVLFRERRRAPRNVCDISLVWHREGEKRKRGKRDIAVRMQELAELMQAKFKDHLDQNKLSYARVEEVGGKNLVIGKRRRLWNIVEKNTRKTWSLETAVASVADNIIFLREVIEPAAVSVIEEFSVAPKGGRRLVRGNDGDPGIVNIEQ
jgi:hypothetical protein